MQDDDIHRLLRLLKKSNRQWPASFMERLANGDQDPFKILIGCVLSLRTRDLTTEQASTRLFALGADPFSIANLPVKKIERAIYPVGFYRIKARQIRAMSKQIYQEFNGKVPDEIETLLTIPGVGRKTANLVRTVGYAKPGICVDIHVHRICNRLGYVVTKNPDETEKVLRGKLPKKHWIGLNGLMVPFGQIQCTPNSPWCSSCPVDHFCPRVGVVVSR